MFERIRNHFPLIVQYFLQYSKMGGDPVVNARGRGVVGFSINNMNPNQGI